jgi:hypothetical protein
MSERLRRRCGGASSSGHAKGPKPIASSAKQLLAGMLPVVDGSDVLATVWMGLAGAHRGRGRWTTPVRGAYVQGGLPASSYQTERSAR